MKGKEKLPSSKEIFCQKNICIFMMKLSIFGMGDVKGNIEKALKMLSAAPLMEDTVISIDEALQLADTEGLIAEMIIIKR